MRKQPNAFNTWLSLSQPSFLGRSAMNKPIISLTAEVLRHHLSYDPDTGIFTWKANRFLSRVGKPAGSIEPEGYVKIGFDQFKCRAHRLAWLYIYGRFPKDDIDHINGIRHDNRIENLREATRAANCQNRRIANNGTGFLGVNQIPSGRFKAKIGKTINGKSKIFYLGYYDTAEEAYAAYLAKKRQIHEGCTI